ncbi:MAG: polysaccharide biosynthesis C-terminal domain-containing protein, partial [Candidatus Latescibacteria bacterium]|nr:polysaccharide biosynthesis C-terminal domain-containing protein [Candidatus Latescibacterota bacterium]
GLGRATLDQWRREMVTERTQAQALWDALIADCGMRIADCGSKNTDCGFGAGVGNPKSEIRKNYEKAQEVYSRILARMIREESAEEAAKEEIAARKAKVDTKPYRTVSDVLGRVKQGLALHQLDFGTWLILGGSHVFNGKLTEAEIADKRATFEQAIAAYRLGVEGGNPQSEIRNPQSECLAAEFLWSPDRRLFFRSMRFGLKAMLISLLLVLLFRADVYLVRYFLGAAATGIYSNAIVFAEMLQKIPNVAGTVLFSKIVAQGGEERDRLTARVSRSIFVLTLVAAGGLALVGNRLIPLVFGVEFEGAYVPLLYMLPGVVAMASGSVINTNLWVQGYPPQAVIAPSAAVCTNVVLNILLIPRFGLIGAGIATSVAYTLWAGLLFAYFSKKTSIAFRELVMVRISDFGFRISD